MKRFTTIAMLIAGISAGSSLSAQPAETDVPDPVQLPAKEQFHLFLLLGQSNMAGRGTIEPEDEIPHPRVLVLNKDGQWRPAVDPLHFDKPVAGVGLGRSFGIQVAESHPGVTVGLIAGQMGDFSDRPWNAARKRVDQAHRDLPARVPHTAFVSSEGLRHQGDGVHFDAASCREFGKRYFQAYLTLNRGR